MRGWEADLGDWFAMGSRPAEPQHGVHGDAGSPTLRRSTHRNGRRGSHGAGRAPAEGSCCGRKLLAYRVEWSGREFETGRPCSTVADSPADGCRGLTLDVGVTANLARYFPHWR